MKKNSLKCKWVALLLKMKMCSRILLNSMEVKRLKTRTKIPGTLSLLMGVLLDLMGRKTRQ
jgi:hypothetical protein